MLTHFVVTADIGRSRRFYVDVLGGEVVRDGEPTIVALGNSWVIINVGGPPTDDKPTVTLEPRATWITSAASSISASPISTLLMSIGAAAGPSS